VDNVLPFNCWYESVCNNDTTKLDKEGHCINTKLCPRYLEVNHLMESSGIPRAKQRPITLVPEDVDYETFCKLADIKNNIVFEVSHGYNIYLCSKHPGNGKTSWALKMLMKYFDCCWSGNGFRTRGLFIHVPTFLLKCKDFNNTDREFEHLKRLIPEVDIVVWDDIGHESISRYDLSLLTTFIDQRILSEKSNIFTSNITNENDLGKVLGARLQSRIWNTSKRFELFGNDRRDM